MASKRKRRLGSTSAARTKLVEAIVAEIQEHGRDCARDRDAFLVRIVARTGLSRAEIERAALDVTDLVREIVDWLRDREQ